MQPRINFINLAVNDLEHSLAFYRDGLGLPTKGVVGSEFVDLLTGAAGTIVFFEMQNGLLLGLYERENLAKDASVQPGPHSSTEMSLGYAVTSKQEVDNTLERVATAGGIITKPAHERPWGVYSGYFKDVDGHLWEVTWDPRLRIE